MQIKDIQKRNRERKAELIKKAQDEVKMRISICEGCDLFKQDTRQCSICDCYMDSKVKAKRKGQQKYIFYEFR